MRPESYTLTNDICARLEACATQGEANGDDDPPRDWPGLMREAIAKLRNLEERLDGMWQDHRWCGS